MAQDGDGGSLPLGGGLPINALRDTAPCARVSRPGSAPDCRDFQSQKVELLGQLAGSVAHEFKNFIAAISMQIELIQENKGLPKEAVSQLRGLEQLASRAASVTSQLLLFSRRREVEIRRMDLNVTVNEIQKLIGRLIGKEVDFRFVPAEVPLWIDAEAGAVEQVVMNLCINSRDAMPHGGHLDIETMALERTGESGRTDAFACLAVRDTGCGIDAGTRARLFEPFFTTKPGGKGTGLGLSTVLEIVKQHGGSVEVESEVGKGSTFRVLFPIGHKALSAPRLDSAPAGTPGRGESVLVVEDDPTICRMILTVLRRSGYRVVGASNASEAIQRWDHESGGFDVLVTDFLLPGGVNGIQLCERLVAGKPGLRTILMSGYALSANDMEAYDAMKIVRLAKPFQMQTLLASVRQCIEAT
jgi:CheY-like chemotaxis protein